MSIKAMRLTTKCACSALQPRCKSLYATEKHRLGYYINEDIGYNTSIRVWVERSSDIALVDLQRNTVSSTIIQISALAAGSYSQVQRW